MHQPTIDMTDRPPSRRGNLEEAPMFAERWLVAGSGAVFLALLGFVFFFANLLPSPGYPSPFSSPEKIERFFSENRSAVRGQSVLLILAGVALLVFVASFGAAVRRMVDRRALVSVAFAGGVLAGGFAMLSAILLWTLSRSETGDAPSLLRALHDLTYLAGGPAHVLAVSVFLFAGSAATWNTRWFPAWVPWLGVVGGAVSSLAVIGLVWEPATFVLVASRVVLGAWIVGVCASIVIDQLMTVRRQRSLAGRRSGPRERVTA